MFIYLITNLLNGKYYIGQTVRTVEDRWKQHKKECFYNFKKFSHLWCALRLHGVENFRIETLCECPDQPSLDEAEKFFIHILGGTKRSIGYNIAPGGRGGEKSPETRAKLSKALKGRKPKPCSEETREKMRKSQTGRKHSPETKTRISQGQMGNKRGPLSDYRKKQIANFFTGKHLSAEQKAKIGKGRKGKKHTPESIAKMQESHRKRVERQRLQKV